MFRYTDSIVADLVVAPVAPGRPVTISRSGAYDFTREAQAWQSRRGNLYLDLDQWCGSGVEGETYRSHRYLIAPEDREQLERAIALDDWEALDDLAAGADHAYGRVGRLNWAAAA